MTIGCSNSSNPAIPNHSDDEINISDNNLSESYSDTRGVFGAWKIQVDTISMTAEILPSRNAVAIGDTFDADLSQFLTVSPCSNCLSIARIFFDGYGDLNITFRMKHPFSNITTRPDLHGFDVRGILIIPSEITDTNVDVIPPSGTTADASYSLWLTNPDGFTSHYDELVTDDRYFIGGSDVPGNLNPFLRFFENYGTPVFDPSSPDGYNVMPVGSSNYDRTAIFRDFDSGILNFYFIADVAYGQSAIFSNRDNPQYYLPAFNRTEAWRVEYWIENNTLDRNEVASTADVVVQIFDWQHGEIVDPAYPDPANLSGIPESSSVAQVELSVPGMFDDLYTSSVPESGTGTPTDPLQYRFTVKNANSWNFTLYTGLLAVRDDLYGQAYPSGRMGIPENPAGFPYSTLDILDYVLYMPIHINFVRAYLPMPEEDTHNAFSNNEVLVPWPDQYAPEHSVSGYRTTLHPDFFMDPGHRQFQYSWDYTYDGVTFNVEGTGIPSQEIEYANPGRKIAALRTRTNSVPPREYIHEIPIYAEGLASTNQIPATYSNGNTTSYARGYSIHVSDENVYLVYSNTDGGQRDIWLAIMNRSGDISTFRVTNDAFIDDHPSLLVIETGSNQGIYITYSSVDLPNIFVYFNKCNLDGSGLIPANAKRVSTELSALEFTPVFLKRDDTISICYMRSFLFTGYIYGSHTDDFGETWNYDGWLVDNGSTAQMDPVVCEGGWATDCLIWQDNMNFAETGWDLWIAETTDGFTFSEIRNISALNGIVHETNPSATYSSGLAIITYLAQNDGESTKNVRLKFFGLPRYMDSHLDYEIDHANGANITHTMPSISFSGVGHNFLSFGAYNQSTNELTAYLLDVQPGYIPGYFDIVELLNQPLGTVSETNMGDEIFPAIKTFRPILPVIEVFMAYRDVSAGSTSSADIPVNTFGEIQMSYFITDR